MAMNPGRNVLQLFIKTVVHNLDNLLLFHVLAYEHQTDDAVAVLFVPDFLELRIFGEDALLFGFAFGGEPASKILGGGLLAGLFEQVAFAALVAEPDETFRADDARRVVIEERFELFAVQRTMVFIDKRADAVFVAVRMVLVMVVSAVANAMFVVAMAVVFVVVIMIVIIIVVMMMFVFIMVVMMVFVLIVLIVVIVMVVVVMFMFVMVVIIVFIMIVVAFFVQLDGPRA